jgi:AbrB family looped-hinge helix DNA binding protein
MATEHAFQPEDEPSERQTYRIKVGPQGRIVIPAGLRETLGVAPGDTLYVRLEDGRLVLETRGHITARIRALVSHVPRDVSVVDELIAERRAEAAREEEEMREWLRKWPPVSS